MSGAVVSGAATQDDPQKAVLLRYLQVLRDVVVWKLEGLPERDQRMPMTTTGTNLLGVVKHLAGTEAGYFGECLGTPFPEPMPWMDEDAEPNEDMWARSDESPAEVLALYRRVNAHADEVIGRLALDAPARVPWWDPPETTLQRLLVHMVVETARHAGQMDVVRESIDGAKGLLPSVPNLPAEDDAWWSAYVARLRELAESAG